MKILSITTTIILLMLMSLDTSNGEDKIKKKSCREHPALSGSCYKIRGKMSFYNGTPSVRIWQVGTKRILGVSEGRFHLDDYGDVPEDLVRQLSWGTAMFADFTVCPFTDDKPGVMRLVCVESAENITVRKME